MACNESMEVNGGQSETNVNIALVFSHQLSATVSQQKVPDQVCQVLHLGMSLTFQQD